MAEAKTVVLIEVQSLVGSGTDVSPFRPLTELFTTDGERVVTIDPTTKAFWGDVMQAGDALAHQLSFDRHGPELTRWWKARGGHDRCTVCKPETQESQR